MSKPAVTILPGLAFYEVWSGAMKALGRDVKLFALEHGQNYQMLRMKACGALNGPDAEEVRQKMIAAVGEDVFTYLYVNRMGLVGAA